MSMQLMALLAKQDLKIAELAESVKVHSDAVTSLLTQVQELRERVADLDDPLRRKTTPGMKAVPRG
jgi:polyhydroxyalkanoate synthesis regulator phasin